MGRFLEWKKARRADQFKEALEKKNFKKVFKFLEAGFDPNHVYIVENLALFSLPERHYETPLDMVWGAQQMERLLCAYGAMRARDFFSTPKGEEFLRLRKEEKQRFEAEILAKRAAEYNAQEAAKKEKVDKLLAKKKRS